MAEFNKIFIKKFLQKFSCDCESWKSTLWQAT